MSTDWRDASERHYVDGVQLEAAGRYANADHLLGISTECSLKAVLLGLGQPPAATGDWPEGHKGHINELWSRFQSTTSGLFDAKYAVFLAQTNPFTGWSVNERYWGSHHFTKNSVDPHLRAARDCRDLLSELILDGVL